MSHAEDEQEHFKEVATSERMRAWGAYHRVASGVYGDALKAESLCDLIRAVGLKDSLPADQRDAFLELLFG